jgi:hypothetical protein
MAECSACHAEVIFVPSARTGNKMILDAKPEKRIVLRWDDAGTYGDRLGEGDGHGTQVADVLNVYTDHHVTCPNVDDFRKKKS